MVNVSTGLRVSRVGLLHGIAESDHCRDAEVVGHCQQRLDPSRLAQTAIVVITPPRPSAWAASMIDHTNG